MTAVEFVALVCLGVLIALTWSLKHHDPVSCRVCQIRRVEARHPSRRADDGLWR